MTQKTKQSGKGKALRNAQHKLKALEARKARPRRILRARNRVIKRTQAQHV